MNYQDQLKLIVKKADWSQDQLASKLSVSFATVNSWINGRSTPRVKAQAKIEDLYFNIVGVSKVSSSELVQTKKLAESLHTRLDTIVNSKMNLRRLTLYLTYHTNTIEGSTMTLSDVENVLFKSKVLSNRTAIEQTEARNHQVTLHWLLDKMVSEYKKFSINEKLIQDIHLRLMHGVVSDAGQYRNHSVRIMGSRVSLANWQRIPDLVASLCEPSISEDSSRIEAIAKFHADFEKIHPFSDGNGRTGRLIMLAQALQNQLMPPLVAKERKNAYYRYLEQAQTKADYDQLELFIAQSMIYTQDILSKDK